MLNQAKKEQKEILRQFLNENTSLNIKSSVKVLKFYGNKWVTDLLRFLCLEIYKIII